MTKKIEDAFKQACSDWDGYNKHSVMGRKKLYAALGTAFALYQLAVNNPDDLDTVLQKNGSPDQFKTRKSDDDMAIRIIRGLHVANDEEYQDGNVRQNVSQWASVLRWLSQLDPQPSPADVPDAIKDAGGIYKIANPKVRGDGPPVVSDENRTWIEDNYQTGPKVQVGTGEDYTAALIYRGHVVATNVAQAALVNRLCQDQRKHSHPLWDLQQAIQMMTTVGAAMSWVQRQGDVLTVHGVRDEPGFLATYTGRAFPELEDGVWYAMEPETQSLFRNADLLAMQPGGDAYSVTLREDIQMFVQPGKLNKNPIQQFNGKPLGSIVWEKNLNDVFETKPSRQDACQLSGDGSVVICELGTGNKRKVGNSTVQFGPGDLNKRYIRGAIRYAVNAGMQCDLVGTGDEAVLRFSNPGISLDIPFGDQNHTAGKGGKRQWGSTVATLNTIVQS